MFYFALDFRANLLAIMLAETIMISTYLIHSFKSCIFSLKTIEIKKKKSKIKLQHKFNVYLWLWAISYHVRWNFTHPSKLSRRLSYRLCQPLWLFTQWFNFRFNWIFHLFVKEYKNRRSYSVIFQNEIQNKASKLHAKQTKHCLRPKNAPIYSSNNNNRQNQLTVFV